MLKLISLNYKVCSFLTHFVRVLTLIPIIPMAESPNLLNVLMIPGVAENLFGCIDQIRVSEIGTPIVPIFCLATACKWTLFVTCCRLKTPYEAFPEDLRRLMPTILDLRRLMPTIYRFQLQKQYKWPDFWTFTVVEREQRTNWKGETYLILTVNYGSMIETNLEVQVSSIKSTADGCTYVEEIMTQDACGVVGAKTNKV